MIELTLPYPISANRYWQSRIVKAKPPRKGMIAIAFPSTEAQSYRDQCAWIAKAAGFRAPLQGRLSVHLQLWPSRPQDWATRMRKLGPLWDTDVRCIDLTNAEKVLLDALNGLAFEDDAQIWRYTAERMEPDEKGARVALRISTIAVRQPQEALL